MAAAIIAAAGTACTLKIYTGTAPTNADTAIGAQVLLVTLTIPGAFGGGVTPTNGVITLGTVTPGTAGATGTAGFCRVATSGAVTLFDLTSIGTSGSDINLNSTSIQSGGTVSITSGTISEVYP